MNYILIEKDNSVIYTYLIKLLIYRILSYIYKTQINTKLKLLLVFLFYLRFFQRVVKKICRSNCEKMLNVINFNGKE